MSQQLFSKTVKALKGSPKNSQSFRKRRSLQFQKLVGINGQTQVSPLNSHQQKTHSVGPFGSSLGTGYSLTGNSYGVPQNQVFASRRENLTVPLVFNY